MDETTLGGALGANTAISMAADYQGTLDNDFRMISVEGFYAAPDLADGEYVVFGLAHGDFTAAQLKECLEAFVDSRSDEIQSEYAMRPVFPIGVLSNTSEGGARVYQWFKKTIRWTFAAPQGWQWFWYNPRSAAHGAARTGVMHAKIYGVWV